MLYFDIYIYIACCLLYIYIYIYLSLAKGILRVSVAVGTRASNTRATGQFIWTAYVQSKWPSGGWPDKRITHMQSNSIFLHLDCICVIRLYGHPPGWSPNEALACIPEESSKKKFNKSHRVDSMHYDKVMGTPAAILHIIKTWYDDL